MHIDNIVKINGPWGKNEEEYWKSRQYRCEYWCDKKKL